MGQLFKYKVDRRYLPLLILVGLRPSKDGVVLTDTSFTARFGFLKLETPLANIDGAHITREYRWWTAIGPRLSQVDDGITFGTNQHAGVCVHFHDKVPSRLKRGGHSALTVTVEDLDGLTEALQR